MGILKDLTKEYFGEKVRKEDEINIDGLNVEIVTFKDNNGNFHRRGYKPKDWYYLIKLLERMVEVRGDEGDFNDIDTSEIEEMNFLFTNKTTFNGDISGWDVSNVKDMEGMFSSATSFNQDISKWNTSEVTNMKDMFCHAASFNQDISKWKFPKVRYMSFMFCNATSFNQDISNWKIYEVDDFFMFKNCPIQDEFKPNKK